jgi:hypothetical protein
MTHALCTPALVEHVSLWKDMRYEVRNEENEEGQKREGIKRVAERKAK